MPELPEVETIRKGLEKYIVGKRIIAVDVRLKKIILGDTSAILNSKILSVQRLGKGLVINFENNYSLAIHVKMTGQLVYVGSDVPKGTKISLKAGGKMPHKHTHVIFKLQAQNAKVKTTTQNSNTDEAVLFYNDIRQFGWIKILKTSEVFLLPFFKDLGPEPLGSLTREKFIEILKNNKTAIKSLLMDQKKISGIGNIYANDSLYLSKIHPLKKSNLLTVSEAKTLYDAIERVLEKGLEVGGASEWQFVNVLGEEGGYQDFFVIYGKDGQKCVECGEIIKRINISGRGTFYCERCQIF